LARSKCRNPRVHRHTLKAAGGGSTDHSGLGPHGLNSAALGLKFGRVVGRVGPRALMPLSTPRGKKGGVSAGHRRALTPRCSGLTSFAAERQR
jgi:hypothetical protein